MTTSSLTSHKTLSSAETAPVFQFKGGLFPLTSIQLLSSDLNSLGIQLDQKIKQAPKFFYNAPMVIDLQKINREETAIHFGALKEILLARNLVPVGVKNGNIAQHREAQAAGFAVIQETSKELSEPGEPEPNLVNHKSKEASDEISKKNHSNEAKEGIQGSNTRVITEPVRSGQQIYARGGDLIVLAPVSHGAELLADGHIHIYGPLRGRALAGITGDIHAHIFCMSLEAELISVAGQYKISEDVVKDVWQKSVNIYLKDGRLEIRTL